jgi:hypothetical protein
MDKNIKSEIAVGIIVIFAAIIGGTIWIGNKQQVNTTQAILPASVPAPSDKQSQPVIFEDKNASTISNTNELQSYQNDEYGFKFQYPQNWKINIDSNNSIKKCDSGKNVCNFIRPIGRQACNNSVDFKTCLGEINFGIINNPKKLWINYFLEEIYGWTEDRDTIKDFNIQKIELGNGYAYKFIEISGIDGSEVSHYWITLGSENFFVIKGLHLEENEKAVLEKVITTFKFTENSVGNKANWETFKNTACTDTGKGLDYYTKGSTMGIYESASTQSGFGVVMGKGDNFTESGMIRSIIYDNCTDSRELTEGYCKAGKLWAVGYTCPNGCKDGACIK